MKDLEDLRDIIDDCDKRIVEAFEERLLAVLDILEYKKENKLPIFQPEREKLVLKKVNSYLKSKNYSNELESLYTDILKSSRKMQSKRLFDYNVVLIGFMGCGKTSIGKELSRLLEMDFIDTDDLIVKNSGLYISEIFDDYGEIGFRKIEKETIEGLLDVNNSIISCGGGVVLDSCNMEILKLNGKVIWLKASPEELYERLRGTTNRPLLQDNITVPRLTEILKTRIELYNTYSDIHVDTDGKGIEDLALEIIDKL